VAEPVVYEKLENAAANQQQPHFYHPPTGSREKKKQLDNNITPSQIDSNVLSSTVKN